MIPWFLIFYMERKFIGEGRRKREIYRETERGRRKGRSKDQPASSEDQCEGELESLALITIKKHSKQSRRIAGTPKLSTMAKGEG